MTPPKVIVIAGWERSGSTILANVLGSAPGVVTLGEINNIWARGFGADLMCACGRAFSSCEMWKPIAEAAFGDGLPSVAERAARAIAPMGNTWLIRRRLPILSRGQVERAAPYAALLARLYASAAETTGARLLVDASKSPWHAAVAYGLSGFEVHVIHLVRDPRGVAHSLRKKVRYDADETRDILMDRHSVTTSSLAWVYRGRLIESTWRGRERAMTLRYEDFVAAPRTVTRRVYAWAGLPGTEAPFSAEDEVELRLSHNVSGNPVRFQHGVVKLRADEAWRSALSPYTAAYIRAITWPHMRHFGYGR
jgi:hypothetical protein